MKGEGRRLGHEGVCSVGESRRVRRKLKHVEEMVTVGELSQSLYAKCEGIRGDKERAGDSGLPCCTLNDLSIATRARHSYHHSEDECHHRM